MSDSFSLSRVRIRKDGRYQDERLLDVMPFSLVHGYRRFGGTSFLRKICTSCTKILDAPSHTTVILTFIVEKISRVASDNSSE